MIRWYHAIFTAYGFWLPNDPRGSWSTFVGSWELFKFGPPTKTTERRSLAHDRHDVSARREAKQALKYPPVRFDSNQRDCIASGIERTCLESNVHLLALTIGYDHAHAVVARHAEKTIEQMVGKFKGRATQAMRASGCHPLARFVSPEEPPPSPWAEGSWSVFINDLDQLRAAIDYVNRHPIKEGLPLQNWSFVKTIRGV